MWLSLPIYTGVYRDSSIFIYLYMLILSLAVVCVVLMMQKASSTNLCCHLQSRSAGAKQLLEKLGPGAVFISSSNDCSVMAGQGTIAVELLEQVTIRTCTCIIPVLYPYSAGLLLEIVSRGREELFKY